MQLQHLHRHLERLLQVHGCKAHRHLCISNNRGIQHSANLHSSVAEAQNAFRRPLFVSASLVPIPTIFHLTSFPSPLPLPPLIYLPHPTVTCQ